MSGSAYRLHPIVPATIVATLAPLAIYLGAGFFDAYDSIAKADFDYGAASIAAVSLVVLGALMLILRHRRELLFYGALSSLLLLVWLFLHYAVDESLRLERPQWEFGYLFIGIVPCIGLVIAAMRGMRHQRATRTEPTIAEGTSSTDALTAAPLEDPSAPSSDTRLPGTYSVTGSITALSVFFLLLGAAVAIVWLSRSLVFSYTFSPSYEAALRRGSTTAVVSLSNEDRRACGVDRAWVESHPARWQYHFLGSKLLSTHTQVQVVYLQGDMKMNDVRLAPSMVPEGSSCSGRTIYQDEPVCAFDTAQALNDSIELQCGNAVVTGQLRKIPTQADKWQL